MNDWLLDWLTVYGLPALFVILVFAHAGVPFPITLLLVFIGSLVANGQFDFWQVLAFAIAGAITGDLIGYGIGRYGGRRLANRIASRFGGKENLERAERFSRKWGGAGVFFSRWLVTPLGPWLNFTSGISCYPWTQFLLWGLLGEAVWVMLYVTIGRVFSNRVSDVAALLGNVIWLLVGLLIAAFLSWNLWQYLKDETYEEPPI